MIFDDVFRWRFGCRKEKGKIKRKIKQRCDVTNEGEEGQAGATEPMVTA